MGTIDWPIISKGFIKHYSVHFIKALVNRAAGTPTGERTSEISKLICKLYKCIFIFQYSSVFMLKYPTFFSVPCCVPQAKQHLHRRK